MYTVLCNVFFWSVNRLCRIWRGTPGLGITYGTYSLRWEPHTDPHIPLKKMIPNLSWKTPTLSLRVLCGCSVHCSNHSYILYLIIKEIALIFASNLFSCINQTDCVVLKSEFQNKKHFLKFIIYLLLNIWRTL